LADFLGGGPLQLPLPLTKTTFSPNFDALPSILTPESSARTQVPSGDDGHRHPGRMTAPDRARAELRLGFGGVYAYRDVQVAAELGCIGVSARGYRHELDRSVMTR
jgi:hypothetical protein